MTITLIAYGIARDILGQRHMKIDIDRGSTVLNMIELLKTRFESFDQLASIQMAINEEYVENDHVMKHEDELVIIPPVSGG